jgi:hypothetical protein
LYAGTQISELLDDNGPFATEVDDFTAWVEAMHDSIRRAETREYLDEKYGKNRRSGIPIDTYV